MNVLAEKYGIEICENFNNCEIASCDWNLLLDQNGGPYHNRNTKTESNFAMEIWNSGCALFGDCDSDAAYWDEILGQGKVWYGVATDDAHSYKELCKGWVMVKAEKNINSILKALENGEFYSSCGPEIYDFYVEDGKAVIDCSPVSRVRLHSDMHPNRVTVDEAGNITHAEFDIENYWGVPYDYVRISIVDKEGKKAWTNPI